MTVTLDTLTPKDVFSKSFIEFLNNKTQALKGSASSEDIDISNSAAAIMLFVKTLMNDKSIQEGTLQELISAASDERTALPLSTLLTRHELSAATEITNDAYNAMAATHSHRSMEDVKETFDRSLPQEVQQAREPTTTEASVGFDVNQVFNAFPLLLREYAKELHTTISAADADITGQRNNILEFPNQ